MKHMLIGLGLGLLMVQASAQLVIKTSSFDLEKISAEKFRFYGGYQDDAGNIVLKAGTAQCDASKESDLTSSTYTFRGVNWNFKELSFDKSLNFVSAKDLSFPSSVEAASYAPIWGTSFRPNEGTFGFLGNPKFTSNYIGKETILLAYDFSSSNIVKGMLYGKVYGAINKTGSNYGCSELPVLRTVTKISAKEEKGQRWSAISGSHSVGGGVGLFMVGGKGFPENKLHYILQKYNLTMEADKKLTIAKDYTSTVQFFDLKKEGVSSEYVLVLQGSKKYAPKTLQTKEADFVEVIVVDATTLEIKWSEITSLPYSKWLIQHAEYTKEGNIFLAGPCGEDKKEFLGQAGGVIISDGPSSSLALGNNAKDFPNFQTMVLTNGKIQKVTGIAAKDAKAKLQVLGGTDSKAKAEPIFTKALNDAQGALTDYVIASKGSIFKSVGSSLVLSYLTMVDGSLYEQKRNGIATMVFNADGELQKYVLCPTAGFSDYYLSANKDENKLYFVNYELSKLNKTVLENGTYEPKAIKNMIAAQLQIAVVDLSNYSASALQIIGANEYAVNAKEPIIADTPERLLFQGRSFNKKAKDSELVLISVEK